ncbi:apolipoprotein L3-like [Eleutherodactylus coqui]|uniref:apolipoprotein L3-like n=1 Tax=Eleutherodactylus coqui TaxID=57060 RepID=UPI003461B149
MGTTWVAPSLKCSSGQLYKKKIRNKKKVDEYKKKSKAEYEHTKKRIKEVTEYQRSIVEDLLTVISDCNKKLLAIAKDLDILHRGATIASVTGSSFGIVGGITTLAGLALAPVTFGTSLMVTAIGVGVAAGGGIAGASASILNIVNTKRKCSEAEDIVKTVDGKLKTFETVCKKQHSLIKALEAMENTGEIADALRSGGRVALVGLELGRLAQLEKLSAVAASGAQLAARGVKVVTAVTVGFAALFMFIDAVFLVKGIQELENDTKTKEATEIRKYVEAFQKLHQDLKGVAEKIAVIECI